MEDEDGEAHGPLWVRRARGKLLRSWTRRHFSLSRSGVLREHSISSTKQGKATSPSAAPVSSSDRSLSVRGAAVRTLSLAAAGRQHAFQLTALGAPGRLVLAAASPQELQRWLAALLRASLAPPSPQLRLNGGSPGFSGPETPSLPLPPPPPPLRALSSVSLASSSSSSASSSATSSPRSPPPSPSALEMEVAQYQDEFVDVSGVQRSDMAHLSAVYEWLNECRVKTTRAVQVGTGEGAALVPRGSLLVAINGASLQTLTPDEIRATLLEGKPVTSIRFLRSPSKRGVLKCKAANRVMGSPSTGSGSLASQLKTMAKTRMANRKGARMNDMDAFTWKEHMVEIDGDTLTFALVSTNSRSNSYHQAQATLTSTASDKVRRRLTTGHIGGSGSAFNYISNSAKSRRGKQSIALTAGCSVKVVPTRLGDHEFCFSVSSSSTDKTGSVVFQAASEREMRQWTDALHRAISIGEGCVPALDREYIDALQDMTTSTTEDGYFIAAEPSVAKHALNEVPYVDEELIRENAAEDDLEADGGDVAPLSLLLSPGVHLPETELSAMLLFLQTQGRFVEALQLVGRNTRMRGAYWREIFQWAGVHAGAGNPMDTVDDARSSVYQALLKLPLLETYVAIVFVYATWCL